MASIKDEWFCNDRWDDNEQLIFFAKLKKAKSKKDFIIRAKGNYLLFSNEKSKINDAINLFELGITECPTSRLLSSFYLQMARCYIKLSDKNKAVEMFKKTIEIQNDTTKWVSITTASTDFPLYVICEQLIDYYDDILLIIENTTNSFGKYAFIKHAIIAIISQQKEDFIKAKKQKKFAETFLTSENSVITYKLNTEEKKELAYIITILNKI